MADMKKVIVQAKINGALTELFVRAGADNVILADGVTTLTAKLAEIAAEIAKKADSATLPNVPELIAAAIANLATKDEVKNATNDMATKTYVGEQIADFITEDEIDNKIEEATDGFVK